MDSGLRVQGWGLMLHSCPRFLTVLQGASTQGGNSRREGRLLKQESRAAGLGRQGLALVAGATLGSILRRTALSPHKCYPQPHSPPQMPQASAPGHPTTVSGRRGASSGRRVNNHPAQGQGMASASPQPSVPPLRKGLQKRVSKCGYVRRGRLPPLQPLPRPLSLLPSASLPDGAPPFLLRKEPQLL